MLYILECNDYSFCIVNQRSIITNYRSGKNRHSLGDEVTFLWYDENTKKKKIYRGKVIDMGGKFKKYFYKGKENLYCIFIFNFKPYRG